MNARTIRRYLHDKTSIRQPVARKIEKLMKATSNARLKFQRSSFLNVVECSSPTIYRARLLALNLTDALVDDQIRRALILDSQMIGLPRRKEKKGR
jgi:hypothetical protein